MPLGSRTGQMEHMCGILQVTIFQNFLISKFVLKVKFFAAMVSYHFFILKIWVMLGLVGVLETFLAETQVKNPR